MSGGKLNNVWRDDLTVNAGNDSVSRCLKICGSQSCNAFPHNKISVPYIRPYMHAHVDMRSFHFVIVASN